MRLNHALILFFLLSGAALAKEEANGTFTVNMNPQEESLSEGVTLSRELLQKKFEGELTGAANGQMLTAVSQVPTSAVYVAIDRFEGTLHGRSGSFAISHRGVMADGEQDLTIAIVPDSGTGELAGISGTMTIDIQDGKHFYSLRYELRQ